jgi:glycerol-3-phosphate dehydrogenase
LSSISAKKANVLKKLCDKKLMMLRFSIAHKHKLLAIGAASGGVLWSQNNEHDENYEYHRKTLLESSLASPSLNAGADENTPLPTREEQVTRLKTTKVFDVLVVGGGATGSGVALDAATRGLSTALVERGDFGNETSSRSTKLIWAGIRYIATAISALMRFHNVSRPVEAIKDFVGGRLF